MDRQTKTLMLVFKLLLCGIITVSFFILGTDAAVSLFKVPQVVGFTMVVVFFGVVVSLYGVVRSVFEAHKEKSKAAKLLKLQNIELGKPYAK